MAGRKPGFKHSTETIAKMKAKRALQVFPEDCWQKGVETRRRNGNDLRGEKNHRWRGDQVNKDVLHLRVRAHKGKASNHNCVDCGKAAAHWSNISRMYLNEDDFEPRCAPCHSKYDSIPERQSIVMIGNSKGKRNKNVMLEQMFAVQDLMAAKFIPIDKFIKKEMPNADVQDWSLRYLDCVIEEVVEMKREYPRRKFWKRGNVSQPHDEAKALEEFADILHFLCAVARINGWTSEEVFKAYMDKYRKNQERFASTRDENRG